MKNKRFHKWAIKIFILLLIALSAFSQKYSGNMTFPDFKVLPDTDPRIEYLASTVSYDTLYTILEFLEINGIRESGGADENLSLDRVKAYISDKLVSWGYEVKYQNVTVNITDHGENIFIEKTGTKFPNKKIVIGAHYDSVPTGPGVNDNGSGTAAILEIARIFADRELDYTLLIVWFTGEEKGLYGSYAFSDTLNEAETDILIMFNLDMIGGIKDQAMTQITCEKGVSSTSEINGISELYTDTLAIMTDLYTSVSPVINYAFSSDYMPFQYLGYVVTGYYEKVGNNPYYHKPTDLLMNMDPYYLEQVTRGAVAYTGYIGRDSDRYLMLFHDPASAADLEDFPFTFSAKVLSDANISRSNFTYSLNGADYVSLEMDSVAVLNDTIFYSIDLSSVSETGGISYYFDFVNESEVSFRQPPSGSYDLIITGIDNEITLKPEKFTVSNAYPNPFNPSTRVDYEILTPGNLEIDVFDNTGSLVESMQNINNTIGKYDFIWNASGLGSGTYFIRFRFNGTLTKTVKAVLLK